MKKILLVLLLIFPTILFTNTVEAKNFGYGIKKEENHQIPYPGKEIATLIEKFGGFYIGDTNSKDIYLTFDAGYENGNTPSILDTLSKTDVKAAFFLTGHYLDKNADLVLRMANEGHVVGNHTWHHPNICKLNKEGLKEEIGLMERKYREITGEEMPKFFRPPEGTFNEQSLKWIQELGYKTVFWSLAYVDWKHEQKKGRDYAYNSIMNYVHNGAIILLHTVSEDNKLALEDIILDLKSQGYSFKSLYDL